MAEGRDVCIVFLNRPFVFIAPTSKEKFLPFVVRMENFVRKIALLFGEPRIAGPPTKKESTIMYSRNLSIEELTALVGGRLLSLHISTLLVVIPVE